MAFMLPVQIFLTSKMKASSIHEREPVGYLLDSNASLGYQLRFLFLVSVPCLFLSG